MGTEERQISKRHQKKLILKAWVTEQTSQTTHNTTQNKTTTQQDNTTQQGSHNRRETRSVKFRREYFQM